MTSKKLIAGAIFAILILAVANQVSAQNFSINITSPSQQNVQLVAGQRVDVQWQIQGTAPTAGNYRVQYCYRSTQCDEAKDWKTKRDLVFSHSKKEKGGNTPGRHAPPDESWRLWAVP